MTSKLDDLIEESFRGSLGTLEEELTKLDLECFNESVFRYLFVRAVVERESDIKPLVECGKIDLVLHRSSDEVAFVEFKFYLKSGKFNPYTGEQQGYKGGPSKQNRREFESCVRKLAERESTQELRKYIVLVYADFQGGKSRAKRYLEDYDDYRNRPGSELVRELLSGEVRNDQGYRIVGKLFEIVG